MAEASASQLAEQEALLSEHEVRQAKILEKQALEKQEFRENLVQLEQMAVKSIVDALDGQLQKVREGLIGLHHLCIHLLPFVTYFDGRSV